MDVKILLADDEEDVRNTVAEYLEQFGYSIDRAESVEPALELMESTEYEIVIADKNMPDKDGTEEGGMNLLRYAKRHFPTTEVLMMTGHASIETSIAAMKLGSFD